VFSSAGLQRHTKARVRSVGRADVIHEKVIRRKTCEQIRDIIR